MDKAEINRQLRVLVEERLFGNGPWIGDRAANQAIHDKLVAWGLQTMDPVTQNISTTELGRELQVDLMTAFMGHHYAYEVPGYLQSFGLITPAEADELIYVRFEQNGERPEDVLPPLLRQLWRQHFNRDAPITH
jgi:hypothetical protein